MNFTMWWNSMTQRFFDGVLPFLRILEYSIAHDFAVVENFLNPLLYVTRIDENV